MLTFWLGHVGLSVCIFKLHRIFDEGLLKATLYSLLITLNHLTALALAYAHLLQLRKAAGIHFNSSQPFTARNIKLVLFLSSEVEAFLLSAGIIFNQ